MGLKDWFTGFKDRFPSFAELRERNRASGRALSRSEGYTRHRTEQDTQPSGLAAQRKEILRLISGHSMKPCPSNVKSFSPPLWGHRTTFFAPRSVEDMWILEVLIDQVLHT
jgi:hypothetical protein